MTTRKPARAVAALVERRPLYLSPAGVRTVRGRIAAGDRDRLDEMLASGALRLVTKDP